jgi:hypothetical protein
MHSCKVSTEAKQVKRKQSKQSLPNKKYGCTLDADQTER